MKRCFVLLALALGGCPNKEPPPTAIVFTEPAYPQTPAVCRVKQYESFKLIPKEADKPDVDAAKVINNTQKYVIVRNLERTTNCNCAVARILHDNAELAALGKKCEVKNWKTSVN